MKAFKDYFIEKKEFKFESIMETTPETAEIVLLVDRSGSMQNGKEDSEGGINAFINEQKTHEGSARITVVTFDNQVEVVYHGDIQKCPEFELKPRGMTALNDAMGESINTLGDLLSGIDKNKRPRLITFVTCTDGRENASKEFSTPQVQEMIKHQTEKYSWNFLFLGADYDAVSDSGYASSTSNAVNFGKANSKRAYEVTSNKLNLARSAVADGADIHAAGCNLDFTEEDREDLGGVVN